MTTQAIDLEKIMKTLPVMTFLPTTVQVMEVGMVMIFPVLISIYGHVVSPKD